jgi:hypothetical protein
MIATLDTIFKFDENSDIREYWSLHHVIQEQKFYYCDPKTVSRNFICYDSAHFYRQFTFGGITFYVFFRQDEDGIDRWSHASFFAETLKILQFMRDHVPDANILHELDTAIEKLKSEMRLVHSDLVKDVKILEDALRME